MDNQKISIENGILTVPNTPTIPFIQGDGIGEDIWKPAQEVIDAAVEKAYNGEKSINWLELLAGEKALEATGTSLPEETIEAFKEYLVGIKGPLMTPVGGGMRSLNVALRQQLDLYTCLRPVKYYTGTPSPVKEPEKVNMHIFRENTEDIYAGIEFMAGTKEAKKFKKFLKKKLGVDKIRFPKSSSFGVKPVSKDGSERLIRAAILYALTHKLPSVTLVHKGNIMKFTEGAFKNWGYELAEREFGDQVFTRTQWETIKNENGEDAANKAQSEALESGKLLVKDFIADAFLQDALINPSHHSVIATLNLNGDYVSDMLAAMVGGIGIAPGGNINYDSGYAIFEATHGTAPAIAGKNIANPGSIILSGTLMLDYMGWTEAADLIRESMALTIEKKTVTSDFSDYMDDATSLSTSDFGKELIKNL